MGHGRAFTCELDIIEDDNIVLARRPMEVFENLSMLGTLCRLLCKALRMKSTVHDVIAHRSFTGLLSDRRSF